MSSAISVTAFAALLGVLEGMALVHTTAGSFQSGVAAWLLFIVLCGITIGGQEQEVSSGFVVRAGAASLVPIFVVVFYVMWIGPAFVSAFQVKNEARGWMFIAVLWMVTLVGVMVSATARPVLIQVMKTAASVTPDQAKRAEKVVNSVVKIAGGIGLAAIYNYLRQ